MSARALAMALPTERSTFGGGATSFSRSILVRRWPSVEWAARVFVPTSGSQSTFSERSIVTRKHDPLEKQGNKGRDIKSRM